MFNFHVKETTSEKEVHTAKPVVRMLPPTQELIIRVNNIDVPISNIAIGSTPPSNPAIGQLWIDTGDSI